MRRYPAEACDYYFDTFPRGDTDFLMLLCEALEIDFEGIMEEKITLIVRAKRAKLR